MRARDGKPQRNVASEEAPEGRERFARYEVKFAVFYNTSSFLVRHRYLCFYSAGGVSAQFYAAINRKAMQSTKLYCAGVQHPLKTCLLIQSRRRLVNVQLDISVLQPDDGRGTNYPRLSYRLERARL